MAVPTLVVLAGGLGSRFGGVKQLAPVGPKGEAIVDYSAAEARAAGFGAVVLVVRSEIEPAVAEHVAHRWPADLAVTLVCQDRDDHARKAAAAGRTKPLGTAHAVLAAAPSLAGPFAVVNADDHYGAEPFLLLAGHLRDAGGSALVTFEVGHTLIGDAAVTRALCDVDDRGRLRGIEEGTVGAGWPAVRVWTGRSGQSRVLRGTEPVSMNFWGFGHGTLEVFAAAVEEFMAGDGVAGGDEVLLPEVARSLVVAGEPFAALATSGRCVGVTHPGDLAIVQALLTEPAW
jgi:hypothetical protein